MKPAPFGAGFIQLSLISATRQLCTTFDVSAAHTTPFASVILLTFTRKLPLLGGMYVLKLPLFLVAVVSTHFHAPPLCFWMTTGTSERQAAVPFATFTWPETRLFGLNPNVTERASAPVVTVKSVALVAVPPGVVTVILPVVAPVGTVAVTDVAVLVVNVAVTPLNLTAVTPVRFVPVMVTLVPTLPLVGENDVIVGTPATVKLVALFAVGATGVVTCSGPVVAPVGTVAVIDVPDTTENEVAAVVLNMHRCRTAEVRAGDDHERPHRTARRRERRDRRSRRSIDREVVRGDVRG